LRAVIPSDEIAIDSAPRKMNQNTTVPVSSDGDRSGATRSMYSPVVLERTARSAPTFSSASFATFASAFATR
jgi:hypothetical protein